MSVQVPDRAEIVVVGGGVIGASVAYHLTRMGRTDVLLLEQGRLSSRHHLARGRPGRTAPRVGERHPARAVLHRALRRLEEETGLSAGYKRCGGVTVARTPERMTQLRRTAATAAAYDLECELLTPEQALERYPVMAVDDLVGAIWLPGDGKANPTDLTQALAKGARMRGARIVEQVRVTGVRVERRPRHGRVAPTAGCVEAEVVVNCAGQWARQVGDLAGVTVPLHSAEHFYVVTEPFAGVHPELPVLRDPDGYTYFKEEVGGLVVGGFEPEAKPWVSPRGGAVPVRVPAAGGGLGALLGADGQRPAPDPGAARDRHPQVLQRSRELHARQPVPARRGARGAWLLRRRGLQLGGHRLRRRRGPGARGVDRRG